MTRLVKFFGELFTSIHQISSDQGCALVFTMVLRFFLIILNSPQAKETNMKVLKIDECIDSYFEKATLTQEAIFNSISVGIIYLRPFIIFDHKNPTHLPETSSIEEDVSLLIKTLREAYKCDDNSFDRVSPMIFVIDEADSLLNYESNSTSMLWTFIDGKVVGFNVFKSVFRNFMLFWKNVWPVFISTSGRISNCLAEIYRDPSRKPAQASIVVPPFELVETFGIHLTLNESYSRNDWNEYLQSPQRITDLYKCGRPLIFDTLMTKCASDMNDNNFLDMPSSTCNDIIFYAAKILGIYTGKSDAFIIIEPELHQIFAVLGLSVAFDDFPRSVDRETLIASHMMTLLGYDNMTGTLNGVYPPEGILNGVASWMLSTT